MSLIGFFQNIFAILSGPLGIAIVGIFLVVGILNSIRERRLAPAEAALIGGGAFYGISWIMNSVMQGAAG